jgi:hypothetical protein
MLLSLLHLLAWGLLLDLLCLKRSNNWHSKMDLLLLKVQLL